MHDGRTAVYRFYDAADRLLYVGITDSIAARWESHSAAKAWWGDIHRATVVWHDSRTTAHAEESAAIAQEHPVHNVLGTGREFRRLGPPFRTAWLAGAFEIQQRLGVNRQRVQQIVAEAGFPAPYATIKVGRIWLTADVERWIESVRRDAGTR